MIIVFSVICISTMITASDTSAQALAKILAGDKPKQMSPVALREVNKEAAMRQSKVDHKQSPNAIKKQAGSPVHYSRSK